MAYQKKTVFTARTLFLVALIALAASRFFVIRQGIIEELASYLLYPIIIGERRIVQPIKDFYERWTSIDETAHLIGLYQKKYTDLLQEYIQLASHCAYLEDYHELEDDKNIIMHAHVILQHFSDRSHHIFLDKGRNDGIKHNMIAVYNNCLVGRVVEVYPYYCKVMVMTDQHFKVAALCTKTKAHGIYEGACDYQTSTLSYVNHLDTLEVGDLVISQGDGLVFPYGFGLGRIKSYKLHGFTYTIDIEPLFDIRSLTVCSLLGKYQEDTELKGTTSIT